MIVVLRVLLTLLLLVGVYRETGPWTTLALFLVMISVELENYYRRKRAKV